jgi:hypothetical protein
MSLLSVYWHNFITSVSVILVVTFVIDSRNFSIVRCYSNHYTIGFGTLKNKQDSRRTYGIIFRHFLDFCFMDNFQLVIPFNPQWSHFLLLFKIVYIYLKLYLLLGYVVIVFWRTYYTCLCWFCYIDFTQLKYFLIAALKTTFHTQFEGIFKIYLHTQFHVPKENLLVLSIMIAQFHFP